jgi:VanZ family protein
LNYLEYPRHRLRTLWLAIGWMLIAVVVGVSLAPIAIDSAIEQGDKYMHAVTYAALMVWFANLYARAPERWLLAAALVALGITLEFMQGWTGYRTFDVADMAANSGGVIAGWLMAPPRLPGFLHAVERLLRA